MSVSVSENDVVIADEDLREAHENPAILEYVEGVFMGDVED